MQPRDSTPPFLPSPLRFFLTVLAIVFLAEAAVTLFLPLVLQYMHGTVGAIADAAMLTVLSAPFLWWLIVRPLRSLAVAEHIRAATIISRALDGIITINEQELVTSVNPAAERLFGYGADEVVGQPLTPLIPERYRDAYQRGLERIRSAEKSDIIGKTIELHGLRKDGSEFPLELSVATWQADEHTFYTGIIRDVTERKRAEQEISNLAKFPAENPQPVLRLNPDGLVLYANEASQALLREWNCDVGGHAPKRWRDLLSDAATSQAKKAHDMECGDRTYMFLLAPILDAGYVNLYGMDITERKRTEEALVRRTRQLEAVRAVTAEITRELDLPAVLSLIIRRAVELAGAKSGAVYLWDEAAQVLVPQVWHGLGDWIKAIRLRLGEGLSGAVAQRRAGMIVNDYRGSPYAQPLFLDQSEVTAVLAEPLLYRDRLLGVITIDNEESGRAFSGEDREVMALFATHAAIAIENARLYEQIRRHAAELDDRVNARTAELEEALRVKAQFLANMSHELRTPLNAVLGFSEVLLGRSPGDITPKQERYLRQIQAGGQRLLTLVTDLLEMTGTEGLPSFHFDRVAVQDLVGEVLEPLAGAARAKQVEMETHLDLSLPVVVADRRKLAQILHHLLTNAIRYTSAGGRVTVTTRRLESAAVLLSGGAAVGLKEPQHGNTAGPQDWVEIRVTDTGIGIRAENLERIFRGFEQVDSSDSRQYGGAGLGLALVRRLAELHGGRVWAESDGEGRGARFIVRLPLLSAPPPPRVLVVEDEALLRAQMVEALREAGFTVLEAPTGTEALAALDGQSPDLLVLDIVLPDMEGWEVLARVRDEGRTRALPVLILTGVDSVQADEAVARGADEFLTKPVSAQVLVETVGRLLRRAAAH